MSENVRHGGRCLCGAVRFEARAEPLWTGYCHCESCRRHTASPVAAFVGFPAEGFSYVAGNPKSFESSPEVWRSFCPTCGTPLTYASTRYPGEVHVYTGALDAPERFAPAGHVYFAERIPWFDTADSLVRHQSTLKSA